MSGFTQSSYPINFSLSYLREDPKDFILVLRRLRMREVK